jgi:NAD(P)-dependent dehydrogenase (short-subunit alcohol dehydrogenase family)
MDFTLDLSAMSSAVFDAHSFQDRVVIVTGGAHGIGRATAQLLASLGARVLATDIHQQRLEALAQQPVADSGELVTLLGDVSNAADLQAAVATAERRWGRIDGLVNNAMAAEHGPIEACSAEQMTKVWQTNLLAAWQLIKLALPLLTVRGGSVVNISSIMAHRPGWAAAPYSSSKAGLEGLTSELAVELGPRRIRVNAIAPGPINTRDPRDARNPGVPDEVWSDYRAAVAEMRRTSQLMQHPWPEPGQSIDVANAIAFLLSDAAAFVNGALLRVDGGAYCFDGVHATREMQVTHAAIREKVDRFRETYPELDRRRRREQGK